MTNWATTGWRAVAGFGYTVRLVRIMPHYLPDTSILQYLCDAFRKSSLYTVKKPAAVYTLLLTNHNSAGDARMNIYRCRYLDTTGYSCRIRHRNWLFVPDLGQTDNRIRKNIRLGDLAFENSFELEYELSREYKSIFGVWVRSLFNRMFSLSRPVTTAGHLLIPER